MILIWFSSNVSIWSHLLFRKIEVDGKFIRNLHGARVINFDLSKIRQSVNAPLTLNIVGQFDDTGVEEEMADDKYRVVLSRITAVHDEGLLKT